MLYMNDIERDFFSMGKVKNVLTARYIEFLEFWLADDEYELRLVSPTNKTVTIKMLKENIEERKRKLKFVGGIDYDIYE